MQGKALESAIYLLLFVPPGVFFTGEGLPSPYFTIVGGLILAASWAVGWVVRALWALLLPLIPWTTALILIALAPADDFGEVTRRGLMILWSVVFLFLTFLVLAGVLMAGQRPAQARAEPPSKT
jgi:hypothetical protein